MGAVLLMRNIRIIVEYDGTCYHGWQRQPNGITIQQVLEEAAGRIVNRPVKIVGSGRTDAGVHALNQVAHFQTESTLPACNLLRGINSLMPADIVIKDLADAEEGFHARYDARSKIYLYYLHNELIRSPLFDRYSWHVSGRLDVDRMRKAAEYLRGTHDFSSFCAAGGDVIDHVRKVFGISLCRRAHGLISFLIEADGFLRYMVRNIVGTLVDAGSGKINPEDVRDILASQNRTAAGITAPPRGLFLKEVKY